MTRNEALTEGYLVDITPPIRNEPEFNPLQFDSAAMTASLWREMVECERPSVVSEYDQVVKCVRDFFKVASEKNRAKEPLSGQKEILFKTCAFLVTQRVGSRPVAFTPEELRAKCRATLEDGQRCLTFLLESEN